MVDTQTHSLDRSYTLTPDTLLTWYDYNFSVMESHDGEEQGLDALTANVRNQEDLERDVAQQV